MPVIVCATTPSSGIRHRFIALRQVKAFADRFGYRVLWLWGVTRGVAFCRYDELFAPVPGVEIDSVPDEQYTFARSSAITASEVEHRGRKYPVLRPGDDLPKGDFFSWDLAGSGELVRRLPGAVAPSLFAKPAPWLEREIDAWVASNGVKSRLGIRVRVEEIPSRDRKPHRVKSELDAVLRSLYRLPWYVRVFVATDSEYIHQGIASHFVDHRSLSKEYDLREPTGGYVHRSDKEAMFTFLKEVACLCACHRVINIGGFLNDGSVHSRTIKEPYDEAVYLHAAPA